MIKETHMLIGIVIGVLLTVLIWFQVCGIIEESKVINGYLTYQGKTYTVELYDTLDKPKKIKEK